MVVGENNKRTANIMEGIESTGDVRLHDHRLRLKQRFDIVRKLGQGTYGKVQLGINKKTGQEVAIKTIKKCKIESDADLIRIRREVQIMSSVRHPNIVHIYEVFENSEKMILVMEYCSGGELYDYLSQQKVLQEDEARRLFRQIATAVYYCHIHKICHRDLKLENVLLDETGSAKIADFGLSNVFKETALLATFCGSPLYASPEIVKGTPYIGPEVDCWSLGVLLYTLVYGAMPFDGSNFKRLVRQISNGDYFEPKSPSSASSLIRDMLTVDPIQRADITYICDHPWVNVGCETSCLAMSEALATETPVRLDLLLSLAPPAPAHTLLLPADIPSSTEAGGGAGAGESGADLTLTSSSMAVEPSNSAEQRILDLVAEGGADAIKPSPTRTLVSAGAGAGEAGKRKLEQAASSSATALHRKRERVASCARLADAAPSQPPVPEEPPPDSPEPAPVAPAAHPAPVAPAATPAHPPPLPLASSATTIVKPSLKSPGTAASVPSDAPAETKEKATGARPRVAGKKPSPATSAASCDEIPPPDKPDIKEGGEKAGGVGAAAEKLTGLSLEPAATPAPNHTPTKPKKLSIAGMNVGTFKEQFERRSSVTSPPDVKKNLSTKAVGSTSKIAKPKAQSEERESQPKTETGGVRLQQIGIEPSTSPQEGVHVAGGVKKTESEPGKGSPADPAALSLQDARRSLQNSMALLSESRPGEDSRRRAARDIISTAIRTGKPPMPYGRSSSAGVTSLSAPAPAPVAPPTAPVQAAPAPRTFRTEALHRVDDHRNRGTSVERIIPIQVASGDSSPPAPHTPLSPVKPPTAAVPKTNQVPLRRLASDNSTRSSELGSSSSVGGASTGEPIKKSAREFIIPIAVEGKGYVTPRQGSLEPETAAAAAAASPGLAARRHAKPRRISLVSGGESEDEDDMHMHRLRSSRAARAESVSSGEEEDEEGFHLLTADNLFSTLLHRVRALTNRLNGEEGTGFSQHPHSLFNNLQSPFFNSPHLSRRHRIMLGLKRGRRWRGRRGGRGGRTRPRRRLRLHVQQALRLPASWVARYTACSDQIFTSQRHQRQPTHYHKLYRPIGSNSKKSSKQQTSAESNTDKENGGLDLSDLDLSSIQLSEKELETLSGLTPALSRRLQRQLLAHLPPAAARSLRRTLSLHAAASVAPVAPSDVPRYSRSHSAQHALPSDRIDGATSKNVPLSSAPPADTAPPPAAPLSPGLSSTDHPVEIDGEFTHRGLGSIPQYCTLPRLKRRSVLSREGTPPATDSTSEVVTPKPAVGGKEPGPSRSGSVRSTPDRSLLSKYLTPERTNSLDESYSSDSGSLLSDPSYIAAYGAPALAGLPTVGSLRRHSARLHGDQAPRNRISRFLRPDFFDTPRDESIYARTKKDKEIETQKILREIREKRNKSAESVGMGSSPTDGELSPLFKDETPRTCLSPLSVLAARERSRSSTPFLPILHNIKETALDSLSRSTVEGDYKNNIGTNTDQDDKLSPSTKETKMTRPKSFPIKNIMDNATEVKVNNENHSESSLNMENNIAKSVQRESKLIRPKSYPASSPSPEKVYITRTTKKDEPSNKNTDQSDIEVSFNVNLPKKVKPPLQKVEILVEGNILIPVGINTNTTGNNVESQDNVLKTGKHILGTAKLKDAESTEPTGDQKTEIPQENTFKTKKPDNVLEDKKPTIKKRIIKKVTTKSKSAENGSVAQDPLENKALAEKKKVTRKIKEKDSSTDNSIKKVPVKKKSVLQSIGQKLEKLTSSKSNSPEKEKIQNNVQEEQKAVNLIRNQREHSVPVQTEPTTESSLIKRAVTITNVSGLDTEPGTTTKTTVSKVLGLFKKFEPKEKPVKVLQAPIALPESEENLRSDEQCIKNINNFDISRIDKPKRPTSLLLNGLERKNKYCGAASDSIISQSNTNDVCNDISKIDNNEIPKNDIFCEQAPKENDNDLKTAKSNLKLDFSRLPRIKQNICQKTRSRDLDIGVDLSSEDNNIDIQTNGYAKNEVKNSNEHEESNSTQKHTAIEKKTAGDNEKNMEADKVSPRIFSCGESPSLNPYRNHESTTPEKEDIVDRIRRKSFYTRFNEKKHKRKSSLVGPGAPEYNPTARLHSLSGEGKYDLSPTSPVKFDQSSTHSNSYDLSPSINSDRFRSLNHDTSLHGSHRHNPRLDKYGGIDRTDAYRSLDRKYTGARSYLDPDGSLSYNSPRYTRTISLFDNEEDAEKSTSQDRDQHKYSRTLSMYSPGNYATYRPKRVRNPAILLKESEKEVSPENILEKIRERKKTPMGAHSKMDIQTEPRARSNITSKSESDGAERVEKTD